MQWKRHTLVMDSRHCSSYCNASHTPAIATSHKHVFNTELSTSHTAIQDDCDLVQISAVAACALAHQPEAQVFTMWIQPMTENQEPLLGAHATTAEDFEKFMRGASDRDPREKLPREYHDLADAFSRKDAATLPPHRSTDHAIHLKEGTPPFRRPYNLSKMENDAVRHWVNGQLEMGLIRSSNSPCAAPVIVVRKPGGGLRICTDYRALNALTTKSKYPIPLIKETLARLSGKLFFTKLDIIAAFNRIRIKEGHEWMTAFNTRYGQFECLVMPFGLCNAPSTFQSYINDALRPFLDDFASAYLDDVLVFSDDLDEHRQHVRKVITKLRDAGLQIDIDKCDFHVQETKYLGLIVTTAGLKMDPKKLDALRNWEVPKNVKDVQSFLGFANYYRQFIYKYSKVAGPLTDLTKGLNKGSVIAGSPAWEWGQREQRAFEELKSEFLKEPILRHFDSDRETLVETDANDFVIAAVIS